MPYITKVDIGGFHAGDIVPDEKAKIWAQMYDVNPTYFVEGKKEAPNPQANLDINKDGKFDKEDKKLAGKVLKTKIKGR